MTKLSKDKFLTCVHKRSSVWNISHSKKRCYQEMGRSITGLYLRMKRLCRPQPCCLPSQWDERQNSKDQRQGCKRESHSDRMKFLSSSRLASSIDAATF